MIGVLVGTGAVLVIRGGLPRRPPNESRPRIALEMTVVAVLAIRIDARLLNGRS